MGRSGLDKSSEQRKGRVWFDLQADIEWAKARLEQRVYEIDAA